MPSAAAPFETADLTALDQLATMVAVADADGRCRFANAALEDRTGVARRALQRGRVSELLTEPRALADTLRAVGAAEVACSRFDAVLQRAPAFGPGHTELPVHVIVSQTDWPGCVMVEMIEIEQQTRADREERAIGQAQAGKELLRNLAHEIKNPLGGIRGAAQLLEMELGDRALAEYTRVIVHEADRLHALVDRLLAPQRRAQVVGDVNIHEICERVRALVLAEFPRGLRIVRDYDVSIPEFRGDREQLIQAVLNVVRNATQALAEPGAPPHGGRLARGDAEIVLRTRIARQLTVGRQRYRLALELHVQDNGPGVPEAIRERIFVPLVSGREGGSGLGLTLAQTFVQQHLGTIECDSAPGRTVFRILIPLP
ncbi:MAG: PAS domain-containing sensor histidine kinase [Burkholderiales bacterium]|nr:PAS domain-containing sensor histidine kinase [Burkholderiales bacterium]